MASSRISQEDAQEGLAALRLVGEGWVRQLALNVRMGAHRTLGLTPRQYAASVGQRLVDPKEAIKELYADGDSPKRIAELTQTSQGNTVVPVLIEAGLIEPAPGNGPTEENRPLGSVADVEHEISDLQRKLDDQRRRAKQDADALKRQHKDKLTELASERKRLESELKAATSVTHQDEERHHKEAEAAVAEIERKFVPHFVQSIVSDLKDARADLSEAIEHGLTESQFNKIDAAHAAFYEELTVAAATVGKEVTA